MVGFGVSLKPGATVASLGVRKAESPRQVQAADGSSWYPIGLQPGAAEVSWLV